MSKEAERAVVAGTEYLWDRISCSQIIRLILYLSQRFCIINRFTYFN